MSPAHTSVSKWFSVRYSVATSFVQFCILFTCIQLHFVVPHLSGNCVTFALVLSLAFAFLYTNYSVLKSFGTMHLQISVHLLDVDVLLTIKSELYCHSLTFCFSHFSLVSHALVVIIVWVFSFVSTSPPSNKHNKCNELQHSSLFNFFPIELVLYND